MVSLKRPDWIRVKSSSSEGFIETLNVVKTHNVHTVCEEALCPNISECWKNKTATFLIMGDTCTRTCGFCNVKTGCPSKLNENEPVEVAKSVRDLGIKYAVITCVTRDDLKDGGAEHFSKVIRKIKEFNPETKVEILISDLRGDENDIETIVHANPDVYGHNLEIVKRLHKNVKKTPSDYEISLNVLKKVKKINPNMITKTGIMVGVGEIKDEVFELIDDVVNAKVDILTIGQYLAPSTSHYPIDRYVIPEEFEEYKKYGELKGLQMISGPLVRSSYKAKSTYETLCNLE